MIAKRKPPHQNEITRIQTPGMTSSAVFQAIIHDLIFCIYGDKNAEWAASNNEARWDSTDISVLRLLQLHLPSSCGRAVSTAHEAGYLEGLVIIRKGLNFIDSKLQTGPASFQGHFDWLL